MTAELLDIDLKDLVAYEGNVRRNVGDITGMVATMKQVGVIQPLIVTKNGTGYKVLAGKRRLAAAAKAGLKSVPCLLRDGNEQLASLVENLQRKDLTTAEEAEGWRQLQLVGMDTATIAKVAGVDKKRVETGLAVAGSEVAAAVTEKHDLTLEQAAAIAEFEDDNEAVKTLTVTAVKNPERFAHLASRMRQERAANEAVKAKRAELQKEGVKLFDGNTSYQMSGPVRLDGLVDDKGKNITEAKHRSCPGHAVKVTADYDGTAHTTAVCLTPAKNGHKDRYGSSSRSTSKPEPGSKEAEKASAERKAVLAGNKEWRAAEPVRREFLGQLLKQRRSIPTHVLPYVAREVVVYPQLVDTNDTTLTEITGVEANPKSTYEYYKSNVGEAVFAKATPVTLPLLMLARIAASREHSLHDPMSWRRRDDADVRYLKFLVDVGYQASDIEKRVIEGKKR